MTQQQHIEQARRLMAMAICSDTTEAYTRRMALSQHAQQEAGVTITEDDPEVQSLVAEYTAEDQAAYEREQSGDWWDATHPGARCPVRE